MKKFLVVFLSLILLTQVSMVIAEDAPTAVGQQAPAVAVVEVPKKKELMPLTFSGYVRLRTLWEEQGTLDENFTFRFDEWSLGLKKDLNENVNAVVAALIYGGNYFFLEHAYVDFKNMPLNGIIRVGASRNSCFGLVPGFPSRKTTNYGMVSMAFTMDRIIGVQYLMKPIKMLELNVGLHNGPDIKTRNVGEGAQVVAIMADRDQTFSGVMRNDTDINKDLSARLGIVLDKIANIGLSGTYGRLSNNDLATVNTAAGRAGTLLWTDKTKSRLGLDFMFTMLDPIICQGEYYYGQNSEFGLTGAQIMLGYQLKQKVMDKGKEVQKPWIDFLCRYGELTPNVEAKPTLSQTWKLYQGVFSTVWRFAPGMQLQFEYEKNYEKDAGLANQVKNDFALVELTFFY
ncbi:MAG: hypothetical protein WC955_11020 [Elusimicrobiota bacterium]